MDIKEFTPLSSLVGGSLLGLSALLLLYFNGKVAGISGIVIGIFNKSKDYTWRILFIIGLAIGPLIALPFQYKIPDNIETSLPIIIIGGLLVGIGATLGSGCTSGHGICGMGRGSKRSIVATMIFITTAIITVFTRNTLGK